MKEMKGRRMERLVVLPFAGGCVSNSSVDIIQRNTKRSNLHADFLPAMSKEDEKALSSGANMKSSFRSLAVPRPNISSSLHRLVKGFSQLFVYEDEVEDAGRNMEIGSPTDVKHVTHIGWDASSDPNPLEGWESLINPEIFSVPSVSLRQ